MLGFTLNQLLFLCFSLRQSNYIPWTEILDTFIPKMFIECLTCTKYIILGVEFLTINEMASSYYGMEGRGGRT